MTMPDPAAARLVFENVTKSFARPDGSETVALDDLSLSLPDRTFVALIGPSGCGKTTVLRAANGLITPDTGRVLLGGAPPVPGPQAGFVFQSFRLIPWADLRGNLDFAMEQLPLTKAERRERADHYLDLVGLSKFASSYPGQLSGGMKQRVALARALCVEPQVLLMDEPFASLDAQSRELMQDEVLRLSRRSAEGAPRTVVFITHSVDEALVLGDRVLLLSPRPGRMAALVDLPFARAGGNPRLHPDFARLREDLWSRLRDMVLSDPQSDFHGRSAMSQSI